MRADKAGAAGYENTHEYDSFVREGSGREKKEMRERRERKGLEADKQYVTLHLPSEFP